MISLKSFNNLPATAPSKTLWSADKVDFRVWPIFTESFNIIGLQNLYKIPPEFDEAVYLKYTNSQKNISSLEDLYIYFTTNGHREFPLNDQYFKIYYDIDCNLFDSDAYFKRYKNENSKLT